MVAATGIIRNNALTFVVQSKATPMPFADTNMPVGDYPQPQRTLGSPSIRRFVTHDGGDPRKTKEILESLDPTKMQIVCGAGIAGHKIGLLAARNQYTRSHRENVVILTDRDHTHMNPITEKREACAIDEQFFPDVMRKMSKDRVTTQMRFNGIEGPHGFQLEAIPTSLPAQGRDWDILKSSQVNAVSFRTNSLVSIFNQACAAEPNVKILTGKGALERSADPTKAPTFVVRSMVGDVIYETQDYAFLWGTDGASSNIRDALAPSALDDAPHLGAANTMTIKTPTEWSFDNFDGLPCDKSEENGAHCFKISEQECYTLITAHEADRSYAYLALSLPGGDGQKIANGSVRDAEYKKEKRRVTDLMVQDPFFRRHNFIKNSTLSDRYVRDVHKIAKIVFSANLRTFLAGDAATSGPPILGLSMNQLAKQLQLADRILNDRENFTTASPAGKTAAEQEINDAHAAIVEYRNGRVITGLHGNGFYTNDHLNTFEQIKNELNYRNPA